MKSDVKCQLLRKNAGLRRGDEEMKHQTALSFLRRVASPYAGDQRAYIVPALREFFTMKDFPLEALVAPNTTINYAISECLFRRASDFISTSSSFIAASASTDLNITLPISKYLSTPEQNIDIDRSMTLHNKGGSSFIGIGAAASIVARAFVEAPVRDTPIGIIGRGAAGILTFAYLKKMGFRNIAIYEKKHDLGIWAQPNVNRGTKNNPRTLNFNGDPALAQAAGDGTKDGIHVKNFLDLVSTNNIPGFHEAEKRVISVIEPGQLNHKIHFDDGTRSFPILINAAGTGKPRSYYDSTRMAYDGHSSGPSQAVRWQQAELSRDDMQGKRFLIVGLGNSAIEMIAQLNEGRRKGINVDYRVATHYPRDSIYNPETTVSSRGRPFRIFRDLSAPDLTGFQGDLDRSRYDYYRALTEDRIIYDVRGWNVVGHGASFECQKGKRQNYSYDRLYVLTGYEQSEAQLEQWGITSKVEDGKHVPQYEYDGEFVTRYGNRHKGYFGIGALMDAPHNRNAVVIPGMMFRLPDLAFSVIMRAIEWNIEQKKLT